jgi:hypothetical protein
MSELARFGRMAHTKIGFRKGTHCLLGENTTSASQINDPAVTRRRSNNSF